MIAKKTGIELYQKVFHERITLDDFAKVIGRTPDGARRMIKGESTNEDNNNMARKELAKLYWQELERAKNWLIESNLYDLINSEE